MTLKDNFQIMKLNIEANILRIQQLLDKENIEKQFIKEQYWNVNNRENVELRQRLKMLRKDTVKFEKMLVE